MSNRDERVPVIFRRWRSGFKDPIALFPTLPASLVRPHLVTCYEHIGQHGAADYDLVIRRTTPVEGTEHDVAALASELTRIGYALSFHWRRTPTLRAEYDENLAAMRIEMEES